MTQKRPKNQEGLIILCIFLSLVFIIIAFDMPNLNGELLTLKNQGILMILRHYLALKFVIAVVKQKQKDLPILLSCALTVLDSILLL